MMNDEMIARAKELDANATKGPWRTGRKDMQSYHGDDGNSFTNIYADDERAGIHLGHQLPLVIGEANGEHKDRDEERANAELIAESRQLLPALASALETALAEVERLRKMVADRDTEPREASDSMDSYEEEIQELRDELKGKTC